MMGAGQQNNHLSPFGYTLITELLGVVGSGHTWEANQSYYAQSQSNQSPITNHQSPITNQAFMIRV